MQKWRRRRAWNWKSSEDASGRRPDCACRFHALGIPCPWTAHHPGWEMPEIQTMGQDWRNLGNDQGQQAWRNRHSGALTAQIWHGARVIRGSGITRGWDFKDFNYIASIQIKSLLGMDASSSLAHCSLLPKRRAVLYTNSLTTQSRRSSLGARLRATGFRISRSGRGRCFR